MFGATGGWPTLSPFSVDWHSRLDGTTPIDQYRVTGSVFQSARPFVFFGRVGVLVFPPYHDHRTDPHRSGPPKARSQSRTKNHPPVEYGEGKNPGKFNPKTRATPRSCGGDGPAVDNSADSRTTTCHFVPHCDTVTLWSSSSLLHSRGGFTSSPVILPTNC